MTYVERQMTVQELIDKLRAFPPDQRVYIGGRQARRWEVLHVIGGTDVPGYKEIYRTGEQFVVIERRA